MNTKAEALLQEGQAYLAIAESSDTKIAAYHAAAEKIVAAREADLNLTYKAIGDRVGKSEVYVRQLKKWHEENPATTDLPFARGEGDHRRRVEERTVPTKHEDKVEMATKLLADPKVAKAAVEATMSKPSPARRAVKSTVSAANAEQRRHAQEKAKEKAKDGALPLPAWMATMVVKMSDWALGIGGLRSEFLEDIRALPHGRQRELAAEAAYRLAAEAGRLGDELAGKSIAEIEDGNIIDLPARKAS